MATTTKRTGKAKATIRFNKDRAGIELIIPDGRRLTADELNILKEIGFKWHKKSHYWYTVYSDDKMKLIKETFLGKEAQFPAQTETKIIRQMAAERAEREAQAKASKPKKAKKLTKTEEFDNLEQKVNQLYELISAMAEAQKQQVSK